MQCFFIKHHDIISHCSIAANLYEPHMASNGLTDIEDVGILVQNNQKTINGLQRETERAIECINEGEREKEREK